MKSKTTIWDVLGVIVIILLLLAITVRIISCISTTVQQNPQPKMENIQIDSSAVEAVFEDNWSRPLSDDDL